MTYEYTISICNYEMEKTVNESLRSILKQTDDRFEILVVDGGSADGSLEVLRRISARYDRVRVIMNPNSGSLGEDRNVSVTEAKGEYVLLNLDADDWYFTGITEFVTIYEKIRAATSEDFYLKGNDLNIGPKWLLEQYGPYRPGIDRGEDRDMWRRLYADGNLLWLRHGSVCESIGYDPTFLGRILNGVSRVKGEIRSGVSPLAYLRWALKNKSGVSRMFHVCLVFYSLLTIPERERYELPGSVEGVVDVYRMMRENSTTVPQAEDRFGINLCDEFDREAKVAYCEYELEPRK